MDLYVNLDRTQASRGLLNSYKDTTELSTPLEYFQSDSGKIRLFFLSRALNSASPWPFVFNDPTGWPSIKYGMGIIGARANGGTFTITDPNASQTTAAIAYNASAATVQTAIRAALTTNFSAAVVTANGTSSWYIDRGVTGALTSELSGTATALLPSGSTVQVINTQVGTGSVNAVYQLTLAKAFPLLVTDWTVFGTTVPDPTVEVVQAGIVDEQNASFRIRWQSDALGGGVNYNFTGDTTTLTVGPFPYDASTDTIAALMAVHPDVGTAASVNVVQNGAGDYTITCVGDGIKQNASVAMAYVSNTLTIPIGVEGVATVSTAGADAILGESDSAYVKVSIEVQQAVDEPSTVIQTDGTLYRDLLGNSPGYQTGAETYIQSGQIRQGKTLRVDSVFGNDSTGTRQYPLNKPFLTLEAARDAANSGDIIEVGAGDYSIAESIAKNGVNWYFSEGATVTFTDDGTDTTAIWDDGGTAMTFTVGGLGTFIREQNGNGDALGSAVVRNNNASSDISIYAFDLIHQGDAERSNVIEAISGTLHVHCRNIIGGGSTNDNSGVWWTNGQMYIEADLIESYNNAAYAAVDSTATGDGYVVAKEIRSTGGQQVIGQIGADANSAFWVRAEIIRGNDNDLGIGVYTAFAGKLYVECQKMFGSLCIFGTGSVYFRADKVAQIKSLGPGSASGFLYVQNASASVRCEVNHWDTNGKSDRSFNIQNGTVHILGGEWIGVNGSTEFEVYGGTVYLEQGFRINQSATTGGHCIRKEGGTLAVGAGCVLIPNATGNSIISSTAQNVVNYGYWTKYAKDANITLLCVTAENVSTDVV